MIKKLSLLLAVLASLFVLAPAQAQAPISVLESRAQADFPQTITFHLRAESQAPITKIALRYEAQRVRCAPVTSEVWPQFSPGTKVETSWTWTMRRTGGLPPGARVSYSWLIADERGNRMETPWSDLNYEDTRYKWKRLTQDKVSILWYEGDQAFAQRLMQAAQGALTRLAQDTGTRLERPVQLYIYASSEALRGARVFPQEWEGGVAFPDHGIIAIGISLGNLAWGETTVAHELSHVVTYQMTLNCYGDLPTWLDEGLATYAEGEPEPNLKARLQRAISQDQLHSVKSLSSSFPAQAEAANLAYAQSYSLVDFLIRRYGQEKMLSLLAAFKEGLTYDEALQKVYGWDRDGLDREWRQSLGLAPRPAPLPTHTPTPALTPAPTPTPVTAPTLTPTPTPAATPSPGAGCRAPYQRNTSSPGPGGLIWLPGIAGLTGLAFLARWRGKRP